MSAGDYRAVAVRIRQELVALQEVADRARGAWAEATGAGDDYHVDATALNLHGFYAGLERLFVIVAERIDGSMPSGANWHQELLQQMSAELPGVRPAVISRTLAADLAAALHYACPSLSLFGCGHSPEDAMARFESDDVLLPKARHLKRRLNRLVSSVKEAA